MTKPEIQCPICKERIEIGDPQSGVVCCRDCNKSIKFEPFEVKTPAEDVENGYWYD